MKKIYLTPRVDVMLAEVEYRLMTASITETIDNAEDMSEGAIGSRRQGKNSLWEDEEEY